MKLPQSYQAPAFTQRLQWLFNPLPLMETCFQKYGDSFTLQLIGGRNFAFFSNPQAIKEVFELSEDKFDAGKGSNILVPLLGEQSVIIIDGKDHQKQRKLLTPPFHGDRMKSYGEIISNTTQEVINKLQIGEAFEVRSLTQSISLKVIVKAVFGITEGERYEQIQKLLYSILEISGSTLGTIFLFYRFLQQDLGNWSPWGKFLRLREQIDKLIYTEIQERRDNSDTSRSDILSLMMSARDEDDQPMTDKQLRDELMTLLFAGHETTASALVWALYWIHALPSVHTKLLAELDNSNDSKDISNITKLPYLNAVCNETLRIYPIAPIVFPRILKSPVKILDYEFPAGYVLAPCIYLTHHQPDLYPESQKFKPERFLERQFTQYEFIAFGGGTRRCIGRAFAMFEMKLVLTTILKNIELKLTENADVKPIRRGITIAPSSGSWLIATSKREPAKLVIKN
ncbi:MAG: cytochrome P450 [Mastigocoleus sp.]